MAQRSTFVLTAHPKLFKVLFPGMDSGPVKAPLRTMKMLLAYMHSGTLDPRTHKLPDVAHLLELAHRYDLIELEKFLTEYLCLAIDAENVCTVVEKTFMIDNVLLTERCWTIVEMIVEGIFSVDLNLSYDNLIDFLQRPLRRVTEVKLFKAVHRLMQIPEYCSEQEKKLIFAQISFDKMTAKQLIEIVQPTKMLSDSECMKIITDNLLYKAQQLHKHVPTSKIATVLTGKSPECLFLDDEWFTSHEISTNPEKDCIMVDLGASYAINHLRFRLSNTRDVFSKYYIETSKTMTDWIQIVDYTKCPCIHEQNIFFSEIICRYVKIVGVDSRSKLLFECNSLQISYVDECPKFLYGIIFPEVNVATNEKAICSTKEILNTYKEEGIDTTFISLQIDEGILVIKFHQPYLLSSCRFRLWDYDGRRYSYTVETTYDGVHFEIVSDKSDEFVGGWQKVAFSSRPVTRFIITGVRASIGNELRVVHFEAPSSC